MERADIKGERKRLTEAHGASLASRRRRHSRGRRRAPEERQVEEVTVQDRHVYSRSPYQSAEGLRGLAAGFCWRLCDVKVARRVDKVLCPLLMASGECARASPALSAWDSLTARNWL